MSARCPWTPGTTAVSAARATDAELQFRRRSLLMPPSRSVCFVSSLQPAMPLTCTSRLPPQHTNLAALSGAPRVVVSSSDPAVRPPTQTPGDPVGDSAVVSPSSVAAPLVPSASTPQFPVQSPRAPRHPASPVTPAHPAPVLVRRQSGGSSALVTPHREASFPSLASHSQGAPAQQLREAESVLSPSESKDSVQTHRKKRRFRLFVCCFITLTLAAQALGGKLECHDVCSVCTVGYGAKREGCRCDNQCPVQREPSNPR